MISKKDGFTLIEVMVAVMIVSVVVAALWQMRGDATQKFLFLEKMQKSNEYATFLLGNAQKYGFDKSTISMRNLLDDFDLESDIRRKLKEIKVTLSYEVIDAIDDNDSMVLEVGQTTMDFEDTHLSMVRMRLQ